MKSHWHLTALLLFLISTSSASSGEDVLAGCYSLDQDDEPWLRIEKKEETYHVSIRDRDGWGESASLHPGSQKELSEIFDNDSDRIKSSLVADMGPFALFQVQAGETYGGYETQTDYIVFILIGAASAHKKDCTS